MTFDYFYGRESDLFSFLRIPKMLFTDEHFKRLSAEAKIMYGLLLDRMCLSAVNDWKDEKGRVYIIYTIDETSENLGCGNKKAGNVLSELENIGLIEKKRQGLTKPNLIYVKNFASEVLKEHFQKCQNDTSGNVESATSGYVRMTAQEPSERRTNNTDNNKTDISKTDSIPFYSGEIRVYGDMPKVEGMEGNGNRAEKELLDNQIYVRESISLDVLVKRYPCYKELLEQIAALIVDVLCSTKKTICVGKEDKPSAIVKSQFEKLNSMHIEYVLEGLQNNTTRVRNMRQYLIAALYNAPLTMDAHYEALVRHDLAYGNTKEEK